jgi:hypothetical protein
VISRPFITPLLSTPVARGPLPGSFSALSGSLSGE